MEPQTFCFAREFQGAASRQFCGEGIEGDHGNERQWRSSEVWQQRRQSSDIGSLKAVIRKSCSGIRFHK